MVVVAEGGLEEMLYIRGSVRGSFRDVSEGVSGCVRQ